MGKVLLVDSNNAVSRGTHAWPRAANAEGLPIGGLYGTARFICNFLADNPDHTYVVLAVDAGCPEFRRRLCPEYKGQREAKRRTDPEQERIYAAYKQQVRHVRHLAAGLGIGFAKAPGYEGDDVIAGLALRTLRDHEVTVYSSDRDFIELVDGKRVRQYTAKDHEWIKAEPTYLFERLLDPKESDNLDGIRGIGEKKAALLLAAWARDYEATHDPAVPFAANTMEALDSFLSWCAYIQDKQPNTKDQATLQKLAAMVAPADATLAAERAAKVRANYKVTCLRRISRAAAEATEVVAYPHDPKTMRDMFRAYGMEPLLQDFAGYRTVYGRLKNDCIPEAACPTSSS